MNTVQLFVTCLVDGFFPEVGKATVTLLERLGYTVEFPVDQTCCGQPAFNAGFHDEARVMAKHLVEVLDSTKGSIVAPSGSCAAMVIQHAPELLSRDPAVAAAARRVASRTHELTSFLVDVAGITDVGASCSATGTYHDSCHGLRDLGIEQQPRTLLAGVDGLDTVPLAGADECCGFGGLFAVEMPEVSAALMRRKLDNVVATGADMLMAGDVSCLMHLAGGLHRQGSPIEVRHVAEVLAEQAE